jgi:hypothetical protein
VCSLLIIIDIGEAVQEQDCLSQINTEALKHSACALCCCCFGASRCIGGRLCRDRRYDSSRINPYDKSIPVKSILSVRAVGRKCCGLICESVPPRPHHLCPEATSYIVFMTSGVQAGRSHTLHGDRHKRCLSPTSTTTTTTTITATTTMMILIMP